MKLLNISRSILPYNIDKRLLGIYQTLRNPDSLIHFGDLKSEFGSNVKSFAIVAESKIGNHVSLGYMSYLYKCKIGNYSYCNQFCNIDLSEIGNFTSIAAQVTIAGFEHYVDNFSTSPSIFNDFSKINIDEMNNKKTFIGHDVWIGHGAFIKKGVKIGNGAVIGARSVVTKDVEPYSIVVGNPARKIKDRFPKEITEQLENSKWWDMKIEDSIAFFKELDGINP